MKEKNEKKKIAKIRFSSRPYYQDLEDIKNYQLNSKDEFVKIRPDDEEKINLKKHLGMYKPVAPAFGIPLMKFNLNPME